MERKRLEKSECRAELLINRSRPVVGEDELSRAIAERRLRDRGVCIGSEDALVESRDERSEQLALTDRPR